MAAAGGTTSCLQLRGLFLGKNGACWVFCVQEPVKLLQKNWPIKLLRLLFSYGGREERNHSFTSPPFPLLYIFLFHNHFCPSPLLYCSSKILSLFGFPDGNTRWTSTRSLERCDGGPVPTCHHAFHILCSKQTNLEPSLLWQT